MAVDDDKPMITAAVQPSLVKAGETPPDEIPLEAQPYVRLAVLDMHLEPLHGIERTTMPGHGFVAMEA